MAHEDKKISRFSNLFGIIRQILYVCKNRFVLINLTLVSSRYFLHQDKFFAAHENIILVDNVKKTIERFDPHNTDDGINGMFYADMLDAALTSVVAFFFPGFEYYFPMNYCYNLPGIQTRFDKRNDYSDGLCVLFSMLYAEYRLSFPDLDRIELLLILTKKFDFLSEKKELGMYLRKHAQKIENSIIKDYPEVEDEDDPAEILGYIHEDSNISYNTNDLLYDHKKEKWKDSSKMFPKEFILFLNDPDEFV